MGELLDRLERATRGVTQPLGFGGAAKRERLAPILLLGTVTPGDDHHAKIADEAGLDGVILLGRNGAKKSDVDRSMKALKGTVVGMWRDDVAGVDPEGIDFRVFSSMETPVSALAGEDHTNVMSVEPELDDSLLRTLDYLPMDAFLVSLTDATSLTVSQLMRLARVRAATSRWIFVHLGVLPTKDELEELRELGVHAVVADLAAHDVSALRDCRQSMLDLPRAIPERKKGRNIATVPSVSSRPATSPAEPEPDEDDWDDD